MREPEKAEAQLREAVKLDGKTRVLKIALARFLASRQPVEAEKLIDEALAVGPQSSDALQLKGELLRARGDMDGALRRFDEALKINPNFLPARLSRANLNIALNRFAAADSDLGPILKLAPKNLEANYLRAYELDSKASSPRRISSSRRSASDFPNSPRAISCRAAPNSRSGNSPSPKRSCSNTSISNPRTPRRSGCWRSPRCASGPPGARSIT